MDKMAAKAETDEILNNASVNSQVMIAMIAIGQDSAMSMPAVTATPFPPLNW